VSDETQRNLDRLVARLQVQQNSDPPPLSSSLNGHLHNRGVTDVDIIERCRSAKNAAKFSALFDRGDTSAHDADDSAADLALMSIMAFWSQDEEQLERLFSASALGQRGKWRDRRDYRRRTIKKALSDLRELYDWGLGA